MRLKSLELKGFKSFANDTLIHFNEPVIGIVGPNGSGKSNIVDAIRWVLGEQKGRELRLENMSDVIFNGTKKRKPAPVAQVSLTFENNLGILPSEYHEVVLSRILYRSGDSEYKLNGVTCRLKDIQSLLIDTGIGSNSYAIIALGMVDDILSDKDNSRRRMFEQAAGVSKYKKRKHETLLKLKLTDDDLNRIEDLLKEIQTNMELFEKQARRTQKYYELKEDFKQFSLLYAARNNRALRDQFAASDKRIEAETDRYGRMEADLAVLHAALEKLKAAHLGDEQTVSAHQKELNALVGRIREIENEKNLAEQKISFLTQSRQHLALQINTAEERLATLRADLQRHRDQHTEQGARVESHAQALASARHHRDQVLAAFTEMMDNRESVNLLQQQQEKEIFQLEKEIAVTQNNRDILIRENTLIDDQAAQLGDETAQAKASLETEHRAQYEAAEALAAVEQQEIERMQHIRDLENVLTGKLDELRQIQRTLDARTHEADLLMDMIANLEGFPESIKFLSRSADWNVSAPLLSDIIYCDQPYRVLVEQVLEPYLNYYVVNAWSDAARAVRLLSQAQKGRANFFIREEFTTLHTARPLQGITPLLDHLQIEAGYEGLVTALLHNVYVADQAPMDEVLRDNDLRGVTIIDREGQMIRRTGQLAGGSVGLFEGKKLGRRKHLEHLDEEIVSLRQTFQQLHAGVKEMQAQLAALQAVDHAQSLKELRLRVVHLSQACTELGSRLQHLQTRSEEFRQKKDNNLRQIGAFDGHMTSANQLLESKRNDLQIHHQALEQSEEKYADIQRARQEAEKTFNEAQLQDLQLRNKLDSLARELTYVTEQIAQIEKTHTLQQQQMTSGGAELDQVKSRLLEHQDTLLHLYEQKKIQETKLTEAEQHYYQQRNEISTVDDQIRHTEKEKSNQQYLINELKEHHHQLKFRLMAISERLQVEFGVRLEDFPADELDESLPLDELEAKVQRQKNRLDNYGEINPMAIEAHREIKERFDTISGQREDILKAKDTLLTTISEIETTATTQFLEAFQNVRENFIEVFRSLFTEDDTCDLVLLDPANPLESEIDIIAKPKGKRPKSLSQLSGGEKTLTAIALLFALYLLKPAPFCIFDEVDAPLDDANIQKFNRIIKKFSSQSQFIIVTHNKSTMAAVDTIYGVYMEEMGISGLSQVDFRAFDERDLLAVQN